jgi:hypothetical protein
MEVRQALRVVGDHDGKGVAYQQFVQILRGIGAILGDDPVFGDSAGLKLIMRSFHRS